MVSVVSTAFGLVSQRYAAAFRRHEDDFRRGGEERSCVCECGDKDGGADGAGAVHAFLLREGGFSEGLGGEVSRCYDDDVELGDFVRLEVVVEVSAAFGGCEVDVGDVGDVLCWGTLAGATSLAIS